MTAKYTPGPWDKCAGYISSGRGVVCNYQFGRESVMRNTTTESEQEANARLIAAAPELLEAAKEALAQEGDWLAYLEQAIRKAEGG